jgi:hypothetical protein
LPTAPVRCAALAGSPKLSVIEPNRPAQVVGSNRTVIFVRQDSGLVERWFRANAVQA